MGNAKAFNACIFEQYDQIDAEGRMKKGWN